MGGHRAAFLPTAPGCCRLRFLPSDADGHKDPGVAGDADEGCAAAEPPPTLRLVQLSRRARLGSEIECKIWPAAAMLARWLWLHRPLLEGQTVLELGAGVGTVGLAAAACGARHVLLTDINDAALRCARANVERNGERVRTAAAVAHLDWAWPPISEGAAATSEGGAATDLEGVASSATGASDAAAAPAEVGAHLYEPGGCARAALSGNEAAATSSSGPELGAEAMLMRRCVRTQELQPRGSSNLAGAPTSRELQPRGSSNLAGGLAAVRLCPPPLRPPPAHPSEPTTHGQDVILAADVVNDVGLSELVERMIMLYLKPRGLFLMCCPKARHRHCIERLRSLLLGSAELSVRVAEAPDWLRANVDEAQLIEQCAPRRVSRAEERRGFRHFRPPTLPHARAPLMLVHAHAPPFALCDDRTRTGDPIARKCLRREPLCVQFLPERSSGSMPDMGRRCPVLLLAACEMRVIPCVVCVCVCARARLRLRSELVFAQWRDVRLQG